MGQPVAEPVKVTGVPGACGDAGDADAVTEEQAVVVSVYAKPGTKASLQPRLLHEVPALLASLAQTEKW